MKTLKDKNWKAWKLKSLHNFRKKRWHSVELYCVEDFQRKITFAKKFFCISQSKQNFAFCEKEFCGKKKTMQNFVKKIFVFFFAFAKQIYVKFREKKCENVVVSRINRQKTGCLGLIMFFCPSTLIFYLRQIFVIFFA